MKRDNFGSTAFKSRVTDEAVWNEITLVLQLSRVVSQMEQCETR